MSNLLQAAAVEQLRFTDEQFIWRFSPNQTDPALLEAIFVGREALLQNVLEKLAESAVTKARHQVLLVGPRGIGKSHFMALVAHRLNGDSALKDKLRIARLNEDETTTSLVQFLVRIYRSLSRDYPAEFPRDWVEDALDQSPKEVERLLTLRLVAAFADRTLLIMVENLNLLFDNLGEKGQQQLRAFLQEHPIAALLASSQQLFTEVVDRNEPFYGFFQTIRLTPLTLSEARELLLKIARSKGQTDLAAFLETPDGRSRVRAIHDLAGGNHRVYIVLSGFITKESLDQLVGPFQKMADDLTPYYQERLRWISPQQRQIVELLCRERGTLTPKEMARRLMARENTIGSQVHKLVENGYLAATKRGRETYYELSEPLMRLSFEVKEQSLLVMLVDFLRIWYRPDELRQLREAGLGPLIRSYIDAAIERSETHPDPRLEVLERALQLAETTLELRELAPILEEQAAATNYAIDWLIAGMNYFITGLKVHEMSDRSFMSANRCFERSIDLGDNSHLAWFFKGTMLELANNDEAADYCYGRFAESKTSHPSAHQPSSHGYERFGRNMHSLQLINKSTSIFSMHADIRFYRAAMMLAQRRWAAGVELIRAGLDCVDASTMGLGDVKSMWGSVIQHSADEAELSANVTALVNVYRDAQELGRQLTVPMIVKPLAWLADGLVRSLAKIDAERVTPKVLEGYVAAVEARVKGLPEFDVALRLFRFGIRYLISRDEAEFVELIRPERRILRQALGLEEPQED
jgi:predicted ArsR family transcriptional regulator